MTTSDYSPEGEHTGPVTSVEEKRALLDEIWINFDEVETIDIETTFEREVKFLETSK